MSWGINKNTSRTIENDASTIEDRGAETELSKFCGDLIQATSEAFWSKTRLCTQKPRYKTVTELNGKPNLYSQAINL